MIRFLVFFCFSLCMPLAFAQEVLQADKDLTIQMMQRQIDLYRKQQLNLNAALATSKKSETKAVAEVKELKVRLQALGMYKGDKDERLLQAVADGRVLSRQLNDLRLEAEKVAAVVRRFTQFATVPDAKIKKDVEAAVVQMEKALMGGFGVQQAPKFMGTLQDAKVLSIDTNSGMLVLNVGSKGDCKVGMTFVFYRGDRKLGEGMVAEVRPHLSGVLVLTKANKEVVFKVGDRAEVKLQR